MRSWVMTLFGILNFLLYLVIIGMWISIPDNMTLNLFTTLAALVLTCGLILANRQSFSKFYRSLYFKNFIGAMVSAFLVLVILGFINFLSYKNVVVWDVTKNKSNSLTDQTVQLLKEVDGEIEFTIFSLKKDYELIRTLVELYRLKKNDIKISFIDAELSPQSVREAGVTKVPSIEISFNDKRSVVSELSELSLTNALIKITRLTDPTIYFSVGHGEIDIASNENEGGSQLANLLKSNTYSLRQLNLRESSQIPKDANVLVIWGPKEGFFPNELEAIKGFVEKGGHLMLALDPDFNGPGQVDLVNLVKGYGAVVLNDLVIDRIKHANGSKGTVPVIHKFDSRHPITKDFDGSVFLPLTSSIKIVDNTSSWTLLGLSNHFPASWGETSREELLSMNMAYNEGVDHKGPLGLFAAFESETRKLLVFGNSTFVINSYRKFPKNFILFLNSLNWLAGEERLIAFNTPVIEDRPIFMNKNQIGLVFYFTVIFCPLALAIIAFVLYKRRQRL
ncbi:MAG: GldG family protein [Bacteriovoracaceae bacterium]|nr:GldG family protein [Bacteriovoracaceae bacterium]